MNIIPSTSKSSLYEFAEPYSIVGGDTLDLSQKDQLGISIILPSSDSSPLNEQLFDTLSQIDVREILAVISNPYPRDLIPLTRYYSKLRFILLTQESNIGLQLNIAFGESLSEHCLVIDKNMELDAGNFHPNFLETMSEQTQLCTAPLWQDSEEEILPTVLGPLVSKGGVFHAQPVSPGKGKTPTLFPWEYCALYQKRKHRAIGGFDSLIQENWWQMLEYGMRAWLWGESITTLPEWIVKLAGEWPPLNTSLGPGYRRFYFKTLATRWMGGEARLMRNSLRTYMRDSGDYSMSIRAEWKKIRQWVRQNRYRYTMDAKSLTESWQWDEI